MSSLVGPNKVHHVTKLILGHLKSLPVEDGDLSANQETRASKQPWNDDLQNWKSSRDCSVAEGHWIKVKDPHLLHFHNSLQLECSKRGNPAIVVHIWGISGSSITPSELCCGKHHCILIAYLLHENNNFPWIMEHTSQYTQSGYGMLYFLFERNRMHHGQKDGH